jgi:IS1 family transposase
VNILSLEQQISVIAALTEGCSIRAVERLTGIHRDTIMRLAARVGLGAIKFHDRTVHSVQVARIELDEAWSYVGKKQRKWTPADGNAKGDQYIYLALASSAKAILSFRVGKRDFENTSLFANDLRERVINAPEISSDGWPSYGPAIRDAFGSHCTHGVIQKVYASEPNKDAARRYSPGYVVAVERRNEIGVPGHISTSYVERQNLTLRMQQRRFTRLTNGFSKKLDHHVAAVGLYVAHYNFCRVHETVRQTPAMALGIADHVWAIGELLAACLDNAPREPRKHHGPRRQFRVIEGGRRD